MATTLFSQHKSKQQGFNAKEMPLKGTVNKEKSEKYCLYRLIGND